MVTTGLGVLRTLGRACREPTSWALFGAVAGLFLAIFFWASVSFLQANPALVMVREQELEEMIFFGHQSQPAFGTFQRSAAVSAMVNFTSTVSTLLRMFTRKWISWKDRGLVLTLSSKKHQ